MESRKRLKFGIYSSFYLCTFSDRNKWRQIAKLSNKPKPSDWSINVTFHSPLRGHGEDVPLHALVKLRQVDPEVDDCQVLDLILVSQIDLDIERDIVKDAQSR